MKSYLLIILIIFIGWVAKTAIVNVKAQPFSHARGSPAIVESGDLDPQQLLGLKLFFDPLLSSTGEVSCATCHDPEHGFASRGKSTGLDNKPLSRKSPTLINVAYNDYYFWDGRAETLERQIIGPIFNKREMGNESMDVFLNRLRPKYEKEFKKEFDVYSLTTIVTALSQYVRTIQSLRGPLDYYLDGKDSLTREQARGYELFRGKAGCYKCHPINSPQGSPRTLTDNQFHNTGKAGPDWGRFDVTHKEEDKGKFKTPGLRGCSLTSPYMHDAGLKTLEDVVEFYNRGGDEKHFGVKDALIFPLRLTPQEKADLTAFLKVL